MVEKDTGILERYTEPLSRRIQEARVLQGLHGRVAEQQFGSGERIEHGEMFLRTVDSRRRAVQIMIQRIAYRVNRLLRHFRRIPAAG